MKKITKYTTGALAVAGLATGLGGLTATTASASELPPYDCAIALPVLEQQNPMLLLGAGCKDNTEKFLEKAGGGQAGGDEQGPGKSDQAPGQNKGEDTPAPGGLV
ncbi:hypothetical protein [Streptomyces sp. 5-10]|uniref:hypothetical protein n=1 Tax=Streptomyces sp. 5-10 TaxID=878925 RepID=UPI00168B7C1B|nr:hypothetical protein [Streptomyces sp. 5-10]MBD3004550.1 hypothetical protein [Streptomyces sp. 5-10]